MLNIEDLRDCLSEGVDPKRRSRLEIAFRSLGYQDNYCRYHYEQYHKEHKLFISAMRVELDEGAVQNPQYYRVAFEANCFAYFRALHSLIESIPYLVNILIGIKEEIEHRFVNWNLIIGSEKTSVFPDGIFKINSLRDSKSYKELSNIVNVSKHRRIVRIDSGMFSENKSARFCAEDFDDDFRSYEISSLMRDIHEDLHPKALDIIKSFIKS